jgi:ketosteroid isomerase-like protein
MRAKDIVQAWVQAFNEADVDRLAEMYRPDAVNHHVAESPVEGRDAIRATFVREFATAKMVGIENLFEDGNLGDSGMARSQRVERLQVFSLPRASRWPVT